MVTKIDLDRQAVARVFNFGGAGTGQDAAVTIKNGTAAASATGLTVEGSQSINGNLNFQGASSWIALPADIRLKNTADTLIAIPTTDGADSKALRFASGGAADNTRGGFLSLFGNEHATQPGQVTINSGAVAGSKIALNTGNAADTVDFSFAGTKLAAVDQSGLLFGATASRICTDTADGTDNKSLILCGGGTGLTSGRGAMLTLKGRESSGGAGPGEYRLESYGTSIASSGNLLEMKGTPVRLTALNATDTIEFVYNLTKRLTFDQTGMIFAGATSSRICMDTADAADNKTLILCGGGGTATTRGAMLTLNGNETGAAGAFDLAAYGNSTIATTAGNLTLTCAGSTFTLNTVTATDKIYFSHGGTARLTMDQTGFILSGATSSRICMNTSDGADNKSLSIGGGGANTRSRGAVLFLSGNEEAGNLGTASLQGGGTTCGSFYLTPIASHIYSYGSAEDPVNSSHLSLHNSTHPVFPGQVHLSSAGAASLNLKTPDLGSIFCITNGTIRAYINEQGLGLGNNSSTIHADTLPGSDNAAVRLAGGGGTGFTDRGASVYACGNNHVAYPGWLHLYAGAVANAWVVINGGGIAFSAGANLIDFQGLPESTSTLTVVKKLGIKVNGVVYALPICNW